MRLRLLGFCSLFVVLLPACGQPVTTQAPESVTGSATAVRGSDGSVEIREATPQEMSRLGSSMSKLVALDESFPRPEMPVGVPSVKALRLRPPGIVELSDGREIRFDGVNCSARGIEVLSRIVVGEKTSLVVVPSVESSDHVVPADVWAVDEIEGGGVSYSSPAESALTSGWCDAEASSTSKHNERYAALVAAFSEERQRDVGAAR